MNTIIGVVVILVGLIVYVGQSLSFFAPEIAAKLGLCEPESELDESLYIIETKANGLSDMLLAWIFPLSGVLLILDHNTWPYFALVGSGIYIYFALLATFSRIFLKRRGKKVGSSSSERVVYIFSGIWIVTSITMIVFAINKLAG